MLAAASRSSLAFSASSIDCAVDPPLPSPRLDLGAPAYLTAHSFACLSNSFGFLMSCCATTASWGSFGSGELRRDCSEIKADLMVRTGDQPVLRVSKQM